MAFWERLNWRSLSKFSKTIDYIAKYTFPSKAVGVKKRTSLCLVNLG